MLGSFAAKLMASCLDRDRVWLKSTISRMWLPASARIVIVETTYWGRSRVFITHFQFMVRSQVKRHMVNTRRSYLQNERWRLDVVKESLWVSNGYAQAIRKGRQDSSSSSFLQRE
ncbi:hypothetical protein V7S43_004772 [Phytophthora oleae]|uniref:Uncharacterized protein n=1 Tax=Phytophthora oleae TaxID=2107226 RepID=A0ABD3FUQ1_9STRA